MRFAKAAKSGKVCEPPIGAGLFAAVAAEIPAW
jgi:hypothetical protein